MIVVKVELWPWGDESKAQNLGRTFIWNKGNGTQNRGNYGVAVMRKDSSDVSSPRDGAHTRTGDVLDYPRLSYNVWRLVVRALKSAFPEESQV